MSLRHFCSFSFTEQPGITVSMEKLIFLRDKVSRWSSAFRQNCARWHWEKTEEDFHALITPDQIRQFETSIAARDAECLLGQLSDAHNIQMTQAQYKLIRDFLPVEISKLTRQGLLRTWQLGNTAEWQRKVMNSSFLWRITRQTAPMVPPELFSLQDQKAGWTSSLKCVWNLLLLTVGQKNVCCYIPMESLRFPVKSTKLLSPYGKGRSPGRAKP